MYNTNEIGVATKKRRVCAAESKNTTKGQRGLRFRIVIACQPERLYWIGKLILLTRASQKGTALECAMPTKAKPMRPAIE